MAFKIDSRKFVTTSVVLFIILQLISVIMTKPIADKDILNRQRRQWGSTCSFWRWSVCRGKKEIASNSQVTGKPPVANNDRIAEGPKPIIPTDQEFKAAYAGPIAVETTMTEKRRTSSHPYEHSYTNGITVKERILMRVLKTLWRAANSENTNSKNLETTQTEHQSTSKQQETNSIERINHRIDEEVSTEIENTKQTHIEHHHDTEDHEKLETNLQEDIKQLVERLENEKEEKTQDIESN